MCCICFALNPETYTAHGQQGLSIIKNTAVIGFQAFTLHLSIDVQMFVSINTQQWSFSWLKGIISIPFNQEKDPG
jgi:hypothetical protein